MTSEPPSSTSAVPAPSPGTGSNPVPGNAAAAAGSAAAVDAAAPCADPVVAAAEMPVVPFVYVGTTSQAMPSPSASRSRE